ncbi:MAG TPA: hypothetical protein VIA64_10275 [Burkholderiales bacterium]
MTIAGAIGGAGGAGGGTAFGGAGAGSGNTIASTVEALIRNNSDVTTTGTVTLTATDSSTIIADAGSVGIGFSGGAGGGLSFAGGGAAAINSIGSETTPQTVRAAILNSTVDAGGAITMTATSTATIDTLAVGIAGTLAGGQAGGVSISGAGAGSGNTIVSVVEALIQSSTVDAGGAVTLTATDASTITADAGGGALALAGGQGGGVGASVGISAASNDIDNSVRAILDDATLTGVTDITLLASSTAKIKALTIAGSVAAAGGAGGGGVFAGAGAGSGNTIDGSIEALIRKGSDVTATGQVTLSAKDNSTITADSGAGGVGFAAGQGGGIALAGAGSVAINTIGSDPERGRLVTAGIIDSTVNAGGAVSVTAQSNAKIDALTVGFVGALSGGAGGGISFGGAGAVAINEIGATTEALIRGSDVIQAGSVSLTATDTSGIIADASGTGFTLALGQGLTAAISIGFAISANEIGNETRAVIDDSDVDTTGDVILSASSTSTIDALAVGVAVAVSGSGGVAGGASGAGANTENSIASTVEALIRNSEEISEQGVTAGQSVGLSATDTSTITSAATSVGVSITASAGAALGGSIVVTPSTNTVTNSVRAGVDNSLVEALAGDVTISATSSSTITATPVGVAVGVTVAPASLDLTGGGARATNTTTNTVEAFVKAGSTVEAAQGVSISATDTSSATAKVVSVSVGGGLVGVAIGVALTDNTINNTVSSFVDGSSVRAFDGDVSVLAGATQTITADAVAVAASLSIGGAGAGAHSKTTIGGTVDAHVTGAALSATGGDVLVKAASNLTADAAANGGAGGSAVGIAVMLPTATIEGTTRAYASGNVTVADGDLEIDANATNTATASTISVGIGLAGGAGGGATAQISRATEAYLGDRLDAPAGAAPNNVSAVNGAVLVEATTSSTATADAAGGAAGGVTIAGFTADATITSATRAYVGVDTAVAAGELDVVARATETARAEVLPVGIGSVTGTGGSAVAKVDSTVEAFVGARAGMAMPGGPTAVLTIAAPTGNPDADGTVNVSAVSTATADADAHGGAAGGTLSVSALLPTATVAGSTRAAVGEGTRVTSQGLTVEATGTNTTTSDIIGVSIGLAGGAGGNATSHVSRTIEASIGTPLGAAPAGDPTLVTAPTGAVAVKATSTNSATSNASGGAAGNVSISAFLANATIGGATRAFVGKNSTIESGSLDVQALTTNTATAGTLSIAVGAVGGAGTRAAASITHAAEAFLDDAVGVETAGGLTVKSTATNTATADTRGGAGGSVAVSVMLADASITGATRAYTGQAVVEAGNVLIEARNTSNADAFAEASGGGIVSGNGADAKATASPTIEASIRGGNVVATGALAVKAISSAGADAEAKGVTIGVLGAVGVNVSTATVAPMVTAYVDGSATADTITVRSLHNYDESGNALDKVAHAKTNASGGGAVGVGSSTAEATANANVLAAVKAGVVLAAGQSVSLVSRSHNQADATADGSTGGIVAVGDASATANAHGTTTSKLENVARLTAGGDLSIVSMGTNRAGALAESANGGGVAVRVTEATADAAPTVRATLSAMTAGPGPTAIAVGGATDIKALALGDATATSDGVGGGVVDVASADAIAKWRPTVEASILSGTTLSAGQDVGIHAYNNHNEAGNSVTSKLVKADAKASGGGVVSAGPSADAEAIVDAAVLARIGSGAAISAGNDLNVIAKSRNNADADARGINGGIVSAGFPSAVTTVTNHARALTDNATELNRTELNAGHDIRFRSHSDSVASATAVGGSGGLAAIASTEAGVHVIDDQIAVRIGDYSNLSASNTILLEALKSVSAHGNANGQVVIAFNSNNFSTSDTDVRLVTRVEVGVGATLDATMVNIHAKVTKLDVDSVAFSRTNSANSTSEANSLVDVSSLASVIINGGARIDASDRIEIVARQDGVDVDSDADAKIVGFTGTVRAKGHNDLDLDSNVDILAGSVLSADVVFIEAESPKAAATYGQTAEADAATVVQWIVNTFKVVEKATSKIPFIGWIVKWITKTVTTVTRVVLNSHESATLPGNFTPENSINLSGDIFQGASTSPRLVIDEDGSLFAVGGVTAEIVGNEVIVSDIAGGEAAGIIDLRSPGGALSGNGTIHKNSNFAAVTIINNSNLDLRINDISSLNPNPVEPDLQFESDPAKDTSSLTVVSDLGSGADSPEVTVQNNSASDVWLAGEIKNPTGVTTVINEGGDILTSPGAFLEGHEVILAAGGQIGSANDSLQLRLYADEAAATLNAQADGAAHLETRLLEIGDSSTAVPAGYTIDGAELSVVAQGEDGDIDIHALQSQVLLPSEEPDGAPTLIDVHGTYWLKSIASDGESVIIESDSGDLDVGLVHAPLATATLTASGSIFDADDDAASDVTALHIVLSAGAGIGSSGNALEVDSGGSGVVSAIAMHDIHLSEVAGDLRLARAESTAGSVGLAAAGTLIDAHDDPASDVSGIAVTLAAGGGMGSAGNALEIDSGFGLVNAIAQQEVNLREIAGDLRLGRVASVAGDVRLEAAGSILDGEDDPHNDIEAANVWLAAETDSIGAGGNAVEIDSAGLVTALAPQSVFLAETAGDLVLGHVSAVLGTVRLAAAAAIRDDEDDAAIDISAPAAMLIAGAGIGHPDTPLETDIGTLNADAGSGGLWIVNDGAITLQDVDAADAVNVVALSPLTVSGDVSGAEIYLEAGDTPAPGDDLTVQTGATITAIPGPVTLVAGDDLTVEAGSLIASDGEVFLSAGGNVQLSGTIIADSLRITGSDGDNVVAITNLSTATLVETLGGNDTVALGTLAPDQGGTLNGFAAPLTLDAGSGSDILSIDDSGDTAADVGTLTASTLTGFGTSGITYHEFETLEISLGSGGNDVDIQGTMRREDFRTVTVINTGTGADAVTASLDAAVDGLAAVNLQAGADFLDGTGSTFELLVFGGDGADTVLGGSAPDTIFGDLGVIDYRDAGGALVTRLGIEPSERSAVPEDAQFVPLPMTDGGFHPRSYAATRGPGLGAADVVSGNDGDDLIFGGAGGDTLSGDGGADTVIGDASRITFGGTEAFDAGEKHAILSFNFTGKDRPEGVTGVAGAAVDPESGGRAGNWNNLAGGGHEIYGNDAHEPLYFDDGDIAPGITIQWGADLDSDAWHDPDPLHEEDHGQITPGTDQDQRLFDGYLSADDYDTVGVNLDGLREHYRTYDVYVYLDMDDQDSRLGTSVRTVTDGATTYYLDDPDGNTFAGTYVAATSTDPLAPQKGNYVVFRGLTSDSVALRIDDHDPRNAGNKPGVAAVQVVGTRHAIDRIETLPSDSGGDDTIYTGDGPDIVFGGGGNDAVDSGAGDDIVVGDEARATFMLGELREVKSLGATAGADVISTGSGNDVVIGGNGADRIAGGEGDDLLLGDNARLLLYGNTVAGLAEGHRDHRFDPYVGTGIELPDAEAGGDDILEGGKGDDLMFGQFGDDTYVFAGGGLGHDALVESGGDQDHGPNDAHDRLDFSLFIGPVEIELGDAREQTVNDRRTDGAINLELTLFDVNAFEDVIGSAFSDEIEGNARNNILIGRGGNDELDGDGGDDVLLGGAGDDDLEGGSDNDLLDGDAGDDDLDGDSGDDILLGGAGDDELDGGDGNDLLDGEGGEDDLDGGDDDDILIGGAGNDELDGDSGADMLEGGDGTDALKSGKSDLLVEHGTRAGQLGLLGYFQPFAAQFSQNGFFYQDPSGGNPARNDRPARDWIMAYRATIPGSGEFLLAATPAAPGSGGPRLDEEALAPILDAAIERWMAASGASGGMPAPFAGMLVSIADLPGLALGQTLGNTITLDIDAGGHGWFVDTTPMDDAEFRRGAAGSLVARAHSTAHGRMDLLSAVMHELGHVLGHEHEESGVMADLLAPGLRSVPVEALLQPAPAVAPNAYALQRLDASLAPAAPRAVLEANPVIDWSARAADFRLAGLPEAERAAPAWASDFVTDLGRSDSERNPNEKLRVKLPVAASAGPKLSALNKG